MDTKDTYKQKIEKQLSNWMTRIDALKVKIEQSEAGARSMLHEQLDALHDKRVKAQKLLDELGTASQDTWDSVRAGVEQGWGELSRATKRTLSKVRAAVAAPSPEEDIRQIAYRLWLDEGCPDGRHNDHWLKAESIWREQQEAKQTQAPAKPKRPRKSASKAPTTKIRRVRAPRRPPNNTN